MEQNAYEQTQTIFREVIRDSRRHPRVPLRRPGLVLLPGGERVPVTVHDVSPDGIQIRCTRARAALVHPSGRSVKQGEVGPPVVLACALPLGDASSTVKITGDLIYFALVNPDLVAIGIRFSKLPAGSREHLVRFVGDALRPREPAA